MTTWKCLICGLIMLLSLSSIKAAGPDSVQYITVHILHGSVPARGYWATEYHMLGGLMGGHVVLELGENVYGFNFTSTIVHPWPYTRHPAGIYQKELLASWNARTTTCKVTRICMPVSRAQYHQLVQLYEGYVKSPPYDYAFFGMRCAAACFHNLSQVGIFPRIAREDAVLNMFFPRPLRYYLLWQARRRGYGIEVQPGSATRVWEK